MIRLYVAATVALLAGQACGGARSAPQHPDPDVPAGSAATGSAGHAAENPQRDVAQTPAVREHPSDQECDALFAHALAVEQAQRPVDQQLGEPELVKVRATLRAQQLPACLQLSRASYRCMLAATTLPALTSCP